MGKLIIPNPPKIPEIEDFRPLKTKEAWTAGEGGGVCFGKKGYETLRYRDELKDYYANTLKDCMQQHNAEFDKWMNSLK